MLNIKTMRRETALTESFGFVQIKKQTRGNGGVSEFVLREMTAFSQGRCRAAHQLSLDAYL